VIVQTAGLTLVRVTTAKEVGPLLTSSRPLWKLTRHCVVAFAIEFPMYMHSLLGFPFTPRFWIGMNALYCDGPVEKW
jgi:hypothetical protein